jgi:hypothetical protein
MAEEAVVLKVQEFTLQLVAQVVARLRMVFLMAQTGLLDKEIKVEILETITLVEEAEERAQLVEMLVEAKPATVA